MSSGSGRSFAHLEEREEYARVLQLIRCESSRNDDQFS